MAKRTQDQAPVEPEINEEEQLAAQERAEEAGGTAEPAGAVDKPVTEMTPEEILARLEARRAELGQLQQVAKAKGIALPKAEAKEKRADTERIEEFLLKLGYSIGMRHWAQSRMNTEGKRAGAALEQLGEAAQDPERLGELAEQLGRGYIKAKLQTSFPSDVMPDKKTAEGATPAQVAEEFWSRVTGEDLRDFPFLEQLH